MKKKMLLIVLFIAIFSSYSFSQSNSCLYVINNPNNTISNVLSQLNFSITTSTSIPSNLTSYDLVIVSLYSACNQTTANYIGNYVQNGGGVILMGGTPSVFCGGGYSTSCISSWFGTSYYSNVGDCDAKVKSDNPLGTSLSRNDVIDHCTGWGAAAVTNVSSDATILVEWESGYGDVFSFIREYNSGRVAFWAGSVNYNSKTTELFKTVCQWCAGNNYNGDLIAYYPFNGNADDESGKGNNGIVYGATITTDMSGNPNSAYRFDGFNDYINISSVSSQMTTTHTRCAWIKTTQYDNSGIIATDNDSDTKGCYMSIDKGKIRFGGRASYFWNGDSSTIIVADGVWHFVCVVYENGDKATLYIDGQLHKEASVYYSVGDWNTVIGRHPSKYQNYFQGSIDEVRIYNRAISEEEIENLWKYSTRIKFNSNKN